MNQMTYDVDLVFCIDATGSMEPVIGQMKTHALSFYENLKARMEKKAKNFNHLRVRVITFRDIFVDERQWLEESPFFVLPAQIEEFNNVIKEIKVYGGGDEPESGLEALARAMQSNWCSDSEKKRHVIVVWTDASAHPLEKAAKAPSPLLPGNLPENFNELTDFWLQKMNRQAKRLLIFAPDAYPWTDIALHWESAIQYASQAGKGLEEHTNDIMLEVIVASI